MTGNELVYQIYEDLNIQSDDTDITDDYIIQLINQQRALWVANEYTPGRSIDPKLIQDLPLTQTEKVSTVLSSDTSNIGFTSEAWYIRTVLEVPRVVETKRTLLYTRIGPADTTAIEYPLIPFSLTNYSGYGRFNSDVPHAFYHNGRIYVTARNSEVHQFIKGMHIRGVFEDPVEAASFNLPSGECWTMDQEYPLSERLFNYIKPQVLDQLRVRISTPSDDTNDASDSPTGNPPEMPRQTQRR